jgi:ceramide glucosyltransferase
MTWALAAQWCLALTLVGVGLVLAGWLAAIRFVRRANVTASDTAAHGHAPITVLKPLHGDEPLLAKALATLCEQDYPPGFQIVFGVGHHTDSAIPVVQRLRSRYPDREIALVVDATRHGANPKISNLINMLPAARHDFLVIADSDVHARQDYLRRMADALAQPNAGVATALYTGLPAFPNLASRLGATQITHVFLAGTLLGRALGRRDCLGATMGLRRETLHRIGGLAALRNHLADDAVLGQRVREQGLDVVLAPTIVATTVPERDLLALWRHELRWARTIRTLEPAGFAASILQNPMVWAALAVIASGGEIWAIALVAGVWWVRAQVAMGIDRSLAPMLGGLAFRCPVWLFPVRDLLSGAEWVASLLGRRVDWRGQTLKADTPPRFTPKESPAR